MHRPVPRSLALLCTLVAAAALLGVALRPARAAQPLTSTPTVYCYLPYAAHVGQINRLHITAVQNLGEQEFVSIYNAGPQEQSMTGWKLHSVNGNEWYDFPVGYVLPVGATVRVESGPAAQHAPPACLRWTHDRIWDDAADEAVLYAYRGIRVDSYAYSTP